MGKYLDKTGLTHLWGKITAAINAAKYTLPAAGLSLGGVKSGGDVTISGGVITVNDDSHNHTIANVDNLQSTLGAKAPLASPTFTGSPKSTTPGTGDNSTRIATTAFVQAAVNSKLAEADAMRFRGVLMTSGSGLPADAMTGDTYKAAVAGTWAGQKCEPGDMLICTQGSDGMSGDATWAVIQANIDGAVTGPASATDGHVAVFSGASGKAIEDGGYSMNEIALISDVNAAMFAVSRVGVGTASSPGTDFAAVKLTVEVEWEDGDGVEHKKSGSGTFTYPPATAMAGGLMSKGDFSKLSGVASGATADSALSNSEIDAAIASA